MKKDNTETESTLFNMSLATLERINEIFKYNNQCSLTMNTQNWLLGLQTLILEVSPMMNKEEETQFYKIYNSINYNPHPRTVREKQDNYINTDNIRKADTFLRNVLWDKGLTMAKKEDIERSML